MKRAAPLCLRDKVKSRFFQLLLRFKEADPRADSRARQRRENPTQGQLEYANSRRTPGGRWSDLELTGRLFTLVDANYDGANF